MKGTACVLCCHVRGPELVAGVVLAWGTGDDCREGQCGPKESEKNM